MRFVPVKSPQQQSTLMLHGAYDLLIGQRTALINALRGHIAELGIVVAQGARNTRQLIAYLQDETNLDLPATARVALRPLAAMLLGIEVQIAKLDKAILAAHRSDPVSTRLAGIPGIGPIAASCLSASIRDASLFQGSREFAAYLGLVPRQHSIGGKARLGPSPRWATGTCASCSSARKQTVCRITLAFDPNHMRTSGSPHIFDLIMLRLRSEPPCPRTSDMCDSRYFDRPEHIGAVHACLF
jgi:transposase